MIFTGIEAFMRRVLLIPFNKVIKEEDRDLDLGEKLKEEIEGIFNFALEGLQRLLKQRHFTNSELMNKAKLEYMGELDVVEDFLLDNPIEVLSGKGVAYISQNELFKILSSWCKENNRKNSYISPRKLRDKLIGKYGYITYKNNNVYGIKGRWISSDEMHRAINNDDYVADDIRDIYTSDD